MSDLLGLKALLSSEDLLRFLARLTLDLGFASVVIAAVYHRLYQNREHVFTYYLFNVITFCVCLLLRKVPIELGFALGLFAVFGILRYRTEAIRMRDLTYLFIVIGLGIVNALANEQISLAELLAVNGVVVVLTAMLELYPSNRWQRSTPLLYDRVDLLVPGHEGALYRDLSKRTGLNVVDVQVKRMDMLRDSAELVIVYSERRLKS